MILGCNHVFNERQSGQSECEPILGWSGIGTKAQPTKQSRYGVPVGLTLGSRGTWWTQMSLTQTLASESHLSFPSYHDISWTSRPSVGTFRSHRAQHTWITTITAADAIETIQVTCFLAFSETKSTAWPLPTLVVSCTRSVTRDSAYEMNECPTEHRSCCVFFEMLRPFSWTHNKDSELNYPFELEVSESTSRWNCSFSDHLSHLFSWLT